MYLLHPFPPMLASLTTWWIVFYRKYQLHSHCLLELSTIQWSVIKEECTISTDYVQEAATPYFQLHDLTSLSSFLHGTFIVINMFAKVQGIWVSLSSTT